jgi:hypothetical protein
MATAYAFLSLVPDTSLPPKFETGFLYTIEFQYTLVGTAVTGDTYTTPLGALPSNGIRIIETQLITPRLDTNSTPTGTMSVGDSGLATRFISAAPMGVTGVTSATYQMSNLINQAQALTAGVVTTGTNYCYGDGTNPQLIVTLGGTIATAAATGLVRLRVSFYCTAEDAGS